MSNRLQQQRISWWRAGRAGLLATVAGNVLLLGLARAAGTPMLKPAWDGSAAPMPVTVVEVVFVSAITFAVGLALAKLVTMRGWSLRSLELAAVTFAVITLGGPLTLETDAGTKLVLASMHLVAGAVYMTVVERVRRRLSPPRLATPESLFFSSTSTRGAA